MRLPPRRHLAACGVVGLLTMAPAVAATAITTATTTTTTSTVATTAEERFDIARFQVDGATLLAPADIDRVLMPLTGTGRAFGDVQRAVDALQQAYRDAGYTAVRIAVPEQELAGGVVRLVVRESVITSVTVTGNTHFSDANVRAALVRLQTGQAPRLGAISESIQLANENPARQLGVTLGEGAYPGSIDAAVTVTDHDPLRVIGTLDNTGSPATGRWRTGLALQHANLFDRDHVGTLAYTLAPDAPSGVDIGIFSAGYRVPLYALGDSIDAIYGKSRASSPASSPVLGGLLGFTGRGEVYGLHWNHFLGRRGESTARLVVGIDHRQIDSRCDIGGVPVSTAGPTPPIAACVPYETTPLSLAYTGQMDSVGRVSAYTVGLMRNIATGRRLTNVDGRTDRYSYLTAGNRTTRDGFMALRGSASLAQSLPADWQLRLAGNAQFTDTPLVASEQFGLVGASLVRGFQERAVAADGGAVLNAEVYTPELATAAGLPGQLRALAFYDIGYGRNLDVGGSGLPRSVTVASMGLGLRYSLGRTVGLRADLARVNQAGNSTTERRGDWNAHLSATLAY